MRSKNTHKNNDRKKTKKEVPIPNWRIKFVSLLGIKNNKKEIIKGKKIKIGKIKLLERELNIVNFLKVETSRLELETFCLQSNYSTIEICPQKFK